MGDEIALPFGSDREAVARLAATIERIGGLSLEPVHRFADGIYAREMTIPEGSLIISHVHRERHLCVCSKGRIVVFTVGGGTRVVTAPATVVSEPGTQRVGFALEDTVWTSFHGTSETDLGVLESTLYDKQVVPPYIEGDAESLQGWLLEIGRTPLLLPERSAA